MAVAGPSAGEAQRGSRALPETGRTRRGAARRGEPDGEPCASSRFPEQLLRVNGGEARAGELGCARDTGSWGQTNREVALADAHGHGEEKRTKKGRQGPLVHRRPTKRGRGETNSSERFSQPGGTIEGEEQRGNGEGIKGFKAMDSGKKIMALMACNRSAKMEEETACSFQIDEQMMSG